MQMKVITIEWHTHQWKHQQTRSVSDTRAFRRLCKDSMEVYLCHQLLVSVSKQNSYACRLARSNSQYVNPPGYKMLLHRRVISSVKFFPFPIYTHGLRATLWDFNVVLKNSTHVTPTRAGTQTARSSVQCAKPYAAAPSFVRQYRTKFWSIKTLTVTQLSQVFIF